jgi:hypothetical protein
MRAAPAVRALLDDARPERVAIVLFHVLSGAALAAWLKGQFELTPSAWMGLVLVTLLVCAAAVGQRLARSALLGDVEYLQWNGQVWTLGQRRPGAGAVQVSELRLVRLVVALDLGSWLLLRLQPAAGASRWQVVRAARVGADWHGLRVALTAHAGSAADAAGNSAQRVKPP